MLRRLIHRLLHRHHFWREANFAEIAELYATRMLRMMAVGMIAVFVGIYLIRSGYSVAFALGCFCAYFLARALFVWPAAHIVAAVGPKHGTLVSNLIYVPALLALSLLGRLGLWALAVYFGCMALSVTLYDISSNVNFSKVRAVGHDGSELGWLYVMTKVGTSIAPLVGGVAATFLGPQAAFILAAGLFVVGAAPLFVTPEPVPTRQHLDFRGFSLRPVARHLVSNLGVGVDMGASGSLWSLFLAVVVLGASGQEIYAEAGLLSSLTLISALVAARAYGLVIDKHRGGELLELGALANSAVHLVRPFITSVPGAASLNVANELATTAYSMPYVKGMSDAADSTHGHRIVYLSWMSVALALGSALIAGLGCLCVILVGPLAGLKLAYIITGLLTLTIMLHGFRALRRD